MFTYDIKEKKLKANQQIDKSLLEYDGSELYVEVVLKDKLILYGSDDMIGEMIMLLEGNNIREVISSDKEVTAFRFYF